MRTIAGIYILKNSSLPGFVKIGYSHDVESMVDQLNSSEATMLPFRIYAVYEVPVGFADKNVQEIIERLFQKQNGYAQNDMIRKIRERNFYSISPSEAYQTLKDLAELHGNEDKLQQFDTSAIEKEEIEALEKMTKGIRPGGKRKCHFRFSMIGLKPGDEVQFKYDPSKSYRIVSDNEIDYKGSPCTLSAVAMELTGRKSGVQGPAFFCYGGEVLDDIRTRMESDK